MSISKPNKLGDTSNDLEYTSFADDRLLPFTDVHHPSLAAAATRTAEVDKKKKVLENIVLRSSRVANSMAPKMTTMKNKIAFKIVHINRVRDAIVCNNCLRPRSIYSESDVSRMRPPSPPSDPETAPDYTIVITNRGGGEEVQSVGKE